MRLTLAFLLNMLFGFICVTVSNPLNPYLSPLISEVKITDTYHWAIELDGDNGYLDAIKRPFPSTTSLLRLRIASSNKIYSIKTSFDNTGIAVITRDSIFGIPKTEMVAIKGYDTISILDTPWTAVGNSYQWNFFVRPLLKQGNSLVNLWYNNHSPFETMRTSIGTRGNYSTVHHLYIQDAHGNALAQAYIYRNYTATVDMMPVPVSVSGSSFVTELTSTKLFSDSIPLIKSGDLLAFSSELFTDAYDVPFSGVIKWPPSIFQWQGDYIDSLISTNDTIILNWQTSLRQPKPSFAVPNVRFSSLQSPGGKITFVIATNSPLGDASIQVMDISGKCTALLSIPIHAMGTYSVSWDDTDNRQKRLSQGTYVCRLRTQGKVIGSQTVKIY